MTTLPLEVWEHILSFLTPPQTLPFCYTCKDYYTLRSYPRLWRYVYGDLHATIHKYLDGYYTLTVNGDLYHSRGIKDSRQLDCHELIMEEVISIDTYHNPYHVAYRHSYLLVHQRHQVYLRVDTQPLRLFLRLPYRSACLSRRECEDEDHSYHNTLEQAKITVCLLGEDNSFYEYSPHKKLLQSHKLASPCYYLYRREYAIFAIASDRLCSLPLSMHLYERLWTKLPLEVLEQKLEGRALLQYLFRKTNDDFLDLLDDWGFTTSPQLPSPVFKFMDLPLDDDTCKGGRWMQQSSFTAGPGCEERIVTHLLLLRNGSSYFLNLHDTKTPQLQPTGLPSLLGEEEGLIQPLANTLAMNLLRNI